MTGHTDPTRAALALALVALALAGAAATTAGAQGGQPTVSVGSAAVTAGGTATVDVVLTSAPDGLAGYLLELSVAGDAARIESVSYPEQFGVTTEPEIGDDGRTVTVETADLEGNVQAGATDVTLATVTLAGTGAGEATLTVEPVQFDADGGAAFQPAVQSGTLSVTDGQTATSSGGSTPTAGSDDGPGPESADGDGEPTDGAGPLSPVLALTALVALSALALLRRR